MLLPVQWLPCRGESNKYNNYIMTTRIDHFVVNAIVERYPGRYGLKNADLSRKYNNISMCYREHFEGERGLGERWK